MKNKQKQYQELSQTISVNGTKFRVDINGYVTTVSCGDLGHMEECQAFASLIHHLFDTFFDEGEI